MCHKDKTFEHYILKLTIDIPFENTIIKTVFFQIFFTMMEITEWLHKTVLES